MTDMTPTTKVDPEFSSPDAAPTSWSTGRDLLVNAKTYWVSSVSPTGAPHVTTIAAVWLEEAIYFVTGKTERKARNVVVNPQVVITTGCNTWEGLDVAVAGRAVEVSDPDRLRRIVEEFTTKYDDFFGFRFDGRHLAQPGTPDEPLVLEIRPIEAFGFEKGDQFSQTRWRFDA